MPATHVVPDRFHQRVEQDPEVPRVAPRVSRVNMGDAERAISTVVGGALLGCGLSRTGLGSIVCAVLGGGLIYSGLTGHCALYDLRHQKRRWRSA